MSEDHDLFNDLEALRIDPNAPCFKKATKSAKKATKWKKHFVRLPWFWVERLRDARHLATHNLAYHLLYEHWRKGSGQAVALSNSAAEGIQGRRKWRALRDLERLGLIKIECRHRKSPLVTMLADK
jgi:hypothetical protein